MCRLNSLMSVLKIQPTRNINYWCFRKLCDTGIKPYDNASNKSAKYMLDCRLPNNKAFAVPCSAHSLNLVEVATAVWTPLHFLCSPNKYYVFLSKSTHRWQCLQKKLNISYFLTESLSNTRWSTRAKACRALK